MKREDVKVFQLCHKQVEYGFIDDDVVTPLEVGADICDNNVCVTKDNTGDNISALNEFYTEDTGLYWIWKNVNCRYKGQMQYRRRLAGISGLDFDDIFEEQGMRAIVAYPMDLAWLYYMPELTLETQYLIAHNIKDLYLMEEIIKEWWPDYAEDYDRYIKHGKNILYSNGFVMRQSDYDHYCAMLFSMLYEWLWRKGFLNERDMIEQVKKYVRDSILAGDISNATMDVFHRSDMDYCIKYQSRIGGSLAERFFTLYAYHNFKDRIYFVDYDKPEGNKL